VPDRSDARDDFAVCLDQALAFGRDEGIAYGLEGHAGLFAQRGDARTAGLLAGAARALRIRKGLVAAAFLLFVFPGRTGELFAWAIALLLATLLHLDKFSQNLSFVTWMALYAVTPFLVAALAIAQRRQDSGAADARDVAIPRPVRIALAAIGACALAAGAVLFVVPQLGVDTWAWDLTPLTARVTGAVLSLTGVVNLALLRDERWSAFRLLFGSQPVSLAAIAASLIAGREALRWDRPITPAFVTLVVVAALSYGAFTLWCERRMRTVRS
jgi:hypothetical protein